MGNYHDRTTSIGRLTGEGEDSMPKESELEGLSLGFENGIRFSVENPLFPRGDPTAEGCYHTPPIIYD